MSELTGKRVFVLGASSAIGTSICDILKSQGATVFGSYNTSKIEDSNFIKINLKDIQKLSDLEKYFEENSFDGFVNCAGVNIAGPLISLSSEQVREQLDVNLHGPILITQMILKKMIRNKKGSVVHLGSVSAHRFFRGHSIYSATKAGLEGFVQAMASEVAKRGIRVNAILPGPVESAMLSKSIEETGMDPKENVPMNRLISANEIAEMTSFLLSDRCPSLTGALIPVDGGYLLW